ncbi:cytochrome c3 family protein [Aestuariivivens sp. NBU2969]|uniref:cytochrome c3 family protein n=1 Tax=Aestuariivivens sp. NBU2969 TaxID=2873267 RepID=UPI001CBB40A8|nr:cytochrome c3 family protein [Aestuariivivens sp. NBU2969]
MKTTKSLFLTLLLSLLGVYAFSQTWSTTNIGNNLSTTAHNFGSNGTYTFADSQNVGDGNGVCAVCHTPHNSVTTLPLWDHAASSSAFTEYTSITNTLDGTFTAVSGASALCLSCHDGTANMDNYSKSDNAGIAMTDGVPGDFGTDLSNDHPISISYPADNVAATQQMDFASNLPAGFLFNNNVECASCHSLHNPAVAQKLLRVSNDNSALCLECHIK